MFNGFPDGTLDFFVDLRFHNNSTWFHENQERYKQMVVAPFSELIAELEPAMRLVDPRMEFRPYKCMSRIHRDTRFSKDKSPYRDHAWFLLRRAGEPREQSLNYYFEYGPRGMTYGMGFWGENREIMDTFRRRMIAHPDEVLQTIRECRIPEHFMRVEGSFFKRIDIPESLPAELESWYRLREMWITRPDPPMRWAADHTLAYHLE